MRQWFVVLVPLVGLGSLGCEALTPPTVPEAVLDQLLTMRENHADYGRDESPLADVVPGEVIDPISEVSGCWGTAWQPDPAQAGDDAVIAGTVIVELEEFRPADGEFMYYYAATVDALSGSSPGTIVRAEVATYEPVADNEWRITIRTSRMGLLDDDGTVSISPQTLFLSLFNEGTVVYHTVTLSGDYMNTLESLERGQADGTEEDALSYTTFWHKIECPSE